MHEKSWHKPAISIMTMITSLSFQKLRFDPTLLFSLAGAVGGVLVVYICPAYIHIIAIKEKIKGGKIENEALKYIEDESLEAGKTFLYTFYGFLVVFGVFVFIVMILQVYGIDI